MLVEIIGKAAGVIALLAYVFYIYSILRGKTKPSRTSWWIWTVVGVILAASYYFSGASTTIWAPIAEVVGPLIIAILSIKYGEGGWTKFDQKIIASVAVTLFLWWLLNSPLIALLAGLFVDFLGAFPTIRKSYHSPQSEGRDAWLVTFISNILNLFALSAFSFSEIVYPIYMFIINGIIVVLLFRKKPFKTKDR